MVAFYGCLLAELVPVPIEVPLTRKVRPHTRARKRTHTTHTLVYVCVLLGHPLQSGDQSGPFSSEVGGQSGE